MALQQWSSALGVARCGRSAGCVLCVLWAMLAAVLGGGGYLVEVSISSSVWAMQAGRENERTIDSRTNDQK